VTGQRHGSRGWQSVLTSVAALSFALALFAALHAPALAQAAKPGQLDRSFGHNGKVKTEFECRCWAHSVAIDSQGRIVAAGGGARQRADFALARYEPNGKLDPSFSGDGQVTTDFFGGSDSALSVAIDSHRRVVAAGYWCELAGCDWNLALARYNHDGSLDGSFGRDGRVRSGLTFAPRAVAIDSRDRIVVVGSSAARGEARFAVARYKPNGTLDRSFGSEGVVTTSMGPPNRTDFANSVAIDSRGRIVAAGYTHDRDDKRLFAVARYKPDGRLDASFSGNGKLRTALGGISYANSVAIDPRGRIVAGGVGQRSRHPVFALARYKSNGRLDRTFSRDGTVMTAVHKPTTTSGVGAGVNAVAIDSRHRIVAAGVFGSVDYPSADSQYALVRYKPNGHLDRSFSGNGKVKLGRSNSFGAQAAAIDSRDRILVADGVHKFVLCRYIGYGRGR
jgi:uncharacterized delta-60 repeat protein